MIDRFSLLYGAGTRTVSFAKEQGIVAATVGDGSYVGDASAEYGSTKCHVLIGRYSSIAHRVTFEVGLNHDYRYATTYPFDDIKINDPVNINHFDEANKNQIVIGNDVWIGCDVIILGGVHIGNGAVIGAGAVVAKDVPPYSIVVGNPARVIKYRFEPEVIQRLQKIKWWYWPAEQIKAKYPLMKEMDRFLAESKDLNIDDNADETVQALQALKEDGYYIYYMVADFNISDPVWRSVLKEYLNNFSDDNKVLLVVEIIGQGNEAFLDEMAKMVEDRGPDAPIVVTHPNTNVISKALLKLVDTFITTKDDSSSVVVDFLSEMDAKIIYGLDYGGHIFTNSPAKTRERPLLTIGIPTYNRSKYLDRCLGAILDDIGNDDSIEVLVSDNNSADNTQEILERYKKKYSNLRVVRQEKNVGANGNYEYLWDNASGEYINLIGDDDYILPGVMKYWKKVLSSNHQISVGIEIGGSEGLDYKLGEGINAYVNEASFLITYISGFLLKTDLLNIEEYRKKMKDLGFDKYRLQQIALQLEVLHKLPNFMCLHGNFFTSDTGDSVFVTPEVHLQKGMDTGLSDIGRVFIKEYYDILGYYRSYGLTEETIHKDKMKLYDSFLLTWSKLVADQRVRWGGNAILPMFDKYYASEPYYKEARSNLAEILKDLDPRIKEDLGDQGELFDGKD